MTSPGLEIIGPSALAASIRRQEGLAGWTLWLVDSELQPVLIAELVESLKIYLSHAPLKMDAADVEQSPPAEAVQVVSGWDSFAEADWRRLDQNRSRLKAGARSVWVMTSASYGRMNQFAPNLASWLGNQVWAGGLENFDLTPEQAEALLENYRAAFKMTDAEFLAAVQAGTLSLDPRAAAWLILLGRGDLLDGQR